MTKNLRKTVVAALALLAVSMSSALAPADDHAKAAGSAGTLMIIHPKALAASAGEWSKYRSSGGWNVLTHEVTADGLPEDLALQLRAVIRAEIVRHASPEREAFNVLLLGDVDAIPTWSFRQAEPSLLDADGPEYASDHPYQLLVDDDESPDIALGRVAVSTDEQARGVLEKVKAYESHPRGATHDQLDVSGRRITYVAGEGRFGPADALMESMFIAMVDTLVPPAFEISMTYASAKSVYCPPPSALTDSVLDRLGEGSLLFNYLGHGWERGFDSLHWSEKRIPILRIEDLDRLQGGPGQRPIALLTCCSAGWYDLGGGQPSLAEALLLHPAGPVAVIAASRPSHPYANTVLQKDVTQLLLADRAATVGELDLRATQSMLKIDALDRQLDAMARPLTTMMRLTGSLADCRLMHARMYNLLGDPATVVCRPELSFRDVQWQDGVLRGQVNGMVSGKVLVTIESARTTPVHADRLQQPLGEDDPDLERKAIANAPLVNDRTIGRVLAAIVDGRFQVPLPVATARTAATVRFFAQGEDAEGNDVSAFGAAPVSIFEVSPAAATQRP